MVRITVELLPKGSESGKTVLGICEIANDGQGGLFSDGHLGNYNVTFSKREPKQREIWKCTRVEGFPRKQLGVWDLLFRALRNAVSYRNP